MKLHFEEKGTVSIYPV